MNEEKYPIITIIGIAVTIGIARLIVGEMGIVGYVVAAAIGGGLSALVKEFLSKRVANKNDVIDQHQELTEQETATAGLTLEPETIIKLDTKPYYYGFGGWLIFYTICQIYTFYITSVGLKEWYSQISSDDIQALRTEGYSDFADRFIILGLIGIVFSALIIVAIIISWIFGIKVSRYYKHSNIIYIAGNSICVFILLAYMYYLNYYTGETLFTFGDIANLAFGALVFVVVWIPYFLKSERVANTFIK